MNPLSNTRIYASEHSYPQPTRNHLSTQERERAKRKLGRQTKGSEIRFGIRTPDGTTVMGLTDSEKHQRRAEELANIIADKQARKDKLTQMVHAQMAVTDNWANKNAGTDYV